MKKHVFVSRILATIIVVLLILLLSNYYPRHTLQRHNFSDIYHELETGFTDYDDVSFAGVHLPIDEQHPLIRERFEKEYAVTMMNIPQLLLYHKRSYRYFPYIKEQLRENNIPEDFVYLAVAESGLRPTVISPAGAAGIWQFLPGTASEFGLLITDKVDERLHFEKSTQAAISYFLKAHDTFDDWALVAASYNRGIGGIKALLKEQKVDSYFDLSMNSETSRYLFRIFAIKLAMEKFSQLYDTNHFGKIYSPISHVIHVSSIHDLAQWSLDHGYSYSTIKDLNPWILGNSLDDGDWDIIVPEK